MHVGLVPLVLQSMVEMYQLHLLFIEMVLVVVPVTSVACSYPDKNITIKIDESSNNPYYLAFVIWYQQGRRDITAVQLCETQNFVCKLLDRSHGAVWTTTSPPSGPFVFKDVV